MGPYNHIDNLLVQQALDQALQGMLEWDQERFLELVDQADSILYLTDNAGEIVFDRLLIEQLPLHKITVAVRGFPVLNDATLEDAKEVGLDRLVKVMNNGSDAPGTILNDCSVDFVESFHRADLIIAKGQGNYETLSNHRKHIIFMLKAKCPVIARDIGCKVGDMVAILNHASVESGCSM
jgi:uncharacterized protein with ATP-grasp and redox domains